MGKKYFRKLTTLKVGGEISYYFEVRSKTEVISVAKFASENSLPIFVLGEGSDVLVGEEKFEGIVIKILMDGVIEKDGGKFVLVKADAGLSWDKLVFYAVSRRYQGIECLSGIPGTVGASPVQNIGAYGQELKDSFYCLTAFDTKRHKFVQLGKKFCDFGYRESSFKKAEYWQRYIIVDVTLKLWKNKPPRITYDSLTGYLSSKGVLKPTLGEARDAVLRIREGKFENYKKTPNAGSFFKNPILGKVKIDNLQMRYDNMPCYKNSDGTYKCYAGWFIEQAGWKGKTYKGAGVSPNHALILINPGGKASANELFELSEKIVDDVYQKFGVKLEREVQIVNFSGKDGTNK